jgi:hypothetical protein
MVTSKKFYWRDQNSRIYTLKNVMTGIDSKTKIYFYSPNIVTMIAGNRLVLFRTGENQLKAFIRNQLKYAEEELRYFKTR